MPYEGWLRTNEHEEAVRSLEWAAAQACSLSSDSYQWKWVLISLHNAVQGVMVLALWNGNGLLALKPENAKAWLKAYEAGKPFPIDRMDNFLNLYGKIQDKDNFHTVGAGNFVPGNSHGGSMKSLNDFRNEFIHFTPKGWSLQLDGLPQICLDVLDIVEFFSWRSPSIIWHDEGYPERIKIAAQRLRSSLDALKDISAN